MKLNYFQKSILRFFLFFSICCVFTHSRAQVVINEDFLFPSFRIFEAESVPAESVFVLCGLANRAVYGGVDKIAYREENIYFED